MTKAIISSSTYEIPFSFEEFHDVLHVLHISENKYLIPSHIQQARISKLCGHMSEHKNVTKFLQLDNHTIEEVCALFHSIIEHVPGTTLILTPAASIVEFPNFDSTLVQIETRLDFGLSQMDHAIVANQ